MEMTRSRPCHKNDQAHVEQKNSTHVRQLLGFDQLRNDLVVPLVSELLEAWSIWRNVYTTTFKLRESALSIPTQKPQPYRKLRISQKPPNQPALRCPLVLRQHGRSISVAEAANVKAPCFGFGWIQFNPKIINQEKNV
ncbi:MAG: hypothetical protein KDN20_23785 [Verrucomicrobiae bacterium]|nr:hypothetical protein [Verrucomicrobiae bacterium]